MATDTNTDARLATARTELVSVDYSADVDPIIDVIASMIQDDPKAWAALALACLDQGSVSVPAQGKVQVIVEVDLQLGKGELS